MLMTPKELMNGVEAVIHNKPDRTDFFVYDGVIRECLGEPNNESYIIKYTLSHPKFVNFLKYLDKFPINWQHKDKYGDNYLSNLCVLDLLTHNNLSNLNSSEKEDLKKEEKNLNGVIESYNFLKNKGLDLFDKNHKKEAMLYKMLTNSLSPTGTFEDYWWCAVSIHYWLEPFHPNQPVVQYKNIFDMEPLICRNKYTPETAYFQKILLDENVKEEDSKFNIKKKEQKIKLF